MSLKVALVGTCPSSRMLAPYNDESWTIWACSPDNAFGRTPRVDAWFEIHGDLEWPESVEWGAPAYLDWLKKQTFPIYAQDQSIIPQSLTFPKDELIKKYHPFAEYNFTSTFAMAFAYALSQGAKEIGLWGIDMEVSTEYAYQRAAVQFWICLARSQGVLVIAPDESSIFQPPPVYGYADATHLGRKLACRRRELEKRIVGMKSQRDQLNHDIAFLEGAEEDLGWVRDTWANHVPPRYGVENPTKTVRLDNQPKSKKEA